MGKNRYEYFLPAHDVDYGVEVRVEDLKVDPQAQRTLNEKRAQSIADHLVREAMGAIVVSQRPNGEMYVVDGMHRKRVCELLGIEKITAEIHHGLDLQQEAVLFLIKNRESSKPNALDEYKVGLTAGLPLFVDTDEVLKRHDLEMGSTSTNSVGAVAGVLRITEQYGPEILDRTLTLAEMAWQRTPQTWDGVLLGGLGMFLGRHGQVVENESLSIKMAKAGPAQAWIGKVHTLASSGGLHNTGTGSRVTTCYGLLVQTWNRGKRTNKLATS